MTLTYGPGFFYVAPLVPVPGGYPALVLLHCAVYALSIISWGWRTAQLMLVVGLFSQVSDLFKLK